MNKNNHSLQAPFLCLFMLTYTTIFSQAINSYEGKKLPEILTDKISHSDIVVEGAIIDKKAFKDSTGTIYTSYLIKMSRIFKGVISDSTIELIYVGGKVGDDIQWRSEGISFANDGIYFLNSNNTNAKLRTNIKSYMFYGNPIIYHHDPVNRRAMIYTFYFDNLDTDLYPVIETVTGTPPKVIGLNLFEIEAAKHQNK